VLYAQQGQLSFQELPKNEYSMVVVTNAVANGLPMAAGKPEYLLNPLITGC
jgi:hypothetical protein